MRKIKSEKFSFNDDAIINECKETDEPIYITKDGKDELVIMSVSSYQKREQEKLAQQMVLESIIDRLSDQQKYTLEESKKLINKMIQG